MASLRAIFDSLRSRPAPGKVLLGVAALAVAGLAWSLLSSGSSAWVRLSADDPAGAGTLLDEASIAHETRPDGIYVSDADRERAAGLITSRRLDRQDAFVEIFSGANIFANPQQVDQQLHHALETELARMIQKMEPVQSASVRIAAASVSHGFNVRGTEATAAVQIGLKPDAEFTEAQARTIADMVSASVKGLKPEGVKISDTRGRFYRVAEVSPDEAISLELRERERRYAKRLEDQISALFPEARRVICVRLSSSKPEVKVEPSPAVQKGGMAANPAPVPAPAPSKMTTPQGDVVEHLSVSVILPVAERFVAGEKDRDEFVRAVVGQLKHATGLDRDDIFRVELHPAPTPVDPGPSTPRTGWLRSINLQDAPWIGMGAAGVVMLLGLILWKRRSAAVAVPSTIVPPPSASEEAAVAGPFEGVGRLSIDRTVLLLGDEHPQTIALVLTHLSTRRAGEVLERIPTALQVDVVRRMTMIQAPTPEVIADVERALDRKLSVQRAQATRRTGSPQQVALILSAINRDTETRILLGVQAQDPALADEIRRTSSEGE